MNFTSIMIDVIDRAKRRERLYKVVPSCPKCGTRQVQLRDSNAPAVWKCRECRFTFNYEPLPE